MISLIIVLIVLGLLLALVQQLPMDDTFKLIIRVVVILAAILALLRFAGMV